MNRRRAGRPGWIGTREGMCNTANQQSAWLPGTSQTQVQRCNRRGTLVIVARGNWPTAPPSPVPIMGNTAARQPSYKTWRSTCGMSQMLDQQHVGMPSHSCTAACTQSALFSQHSQHALAALDVACALILRLRIFGCKCRLSAPDSRPLWLSRLSAFVMMKLQDLHPHCMRLDRLRTWELGQLAGNSITIRVLAAILRAKLIMTGMATDA